MELIWAVPVVAAAVAALLVASRARALEDETTELARSVRGLRAVSPALRSVRDMAAETEELVRSFRERHPAVDGRDAGSADPGPATPDGGRPAG